MEMSCTTTAHSDWAQLYGLAEQELAPVAEPAPASSSTSGANAAQPNSDRRGARPSRRRSRASRRAPTTLLNTDTTNFRAMVQQFTGFPSAGGQQMAYNYQPAGPPLGQFDQHQHVVAPFGAQQPPTHPLLQQYGHHHHRRQQQEEPAWNNTAPFVSGFAGGVNGDNIGGAHRTHMPAFSGGFTMEGMPSLQEPLSRPPSICMTGGTTTGTEAFMFNT